MDIKNLLIKMYKNLKILNNMFKDKKIIENENKNKINENKIIKIIIMKD